MATISVNPKPKFAVIGGGLGGAALSISLTRAGIPHTVYESAAEFSEIGAGISLLPNAIQAMLKVEPKLAGWIESETMWDKSSRDRKTTMIYKVGMKEMTSGKRFGDRIHSVEGPSWHCAHRARLLEELVRHIPPDTVRLKKSLVEIQQSNSKYQLKFADGTSAFADAVIGCDGIKSVTKRFVLGDDNLALKPVFTNTYAYRGLVPLCAVERLLGSDASTLMIHMGYKSHVVSYPVNGQMVNVGAFCSPDGLTSWDSNEWVTPGTRQEMLQQFDGFGDPIRQVIERIEKTDKWGIFESLPARTYAKDRVCILGDAAHASTPYHGSGVAVAFEDGFILAGLLSGASTLEDIELAFRAFDEVRRPRTQAFVRSSNDIGRLDSFQLDGVGDDFEKIASVWTNRYTWLMDIDLEKELERGRRIMQTVGK